MASSENLSLRFLKAHVVLWLHQLLVTSSEALVTSSVLAGQEPLVASCYFGRQRPTPLCCGLPCGFAHIYRRVLSRKRRSKQSLDAFKRRDQLAA